MLSATTRFGVRALLLRDHHPASRTLGSVRTFTGLKARRARTFADIGIDPKSSTDFRKSPFTKDRVTWQSCRRFPFDSKEVHYVKPLLPEAGRPVQRIPRMEDYRRSFDRKDVGRKPKPALELPAIKFAVREWPKKYTTKPLATWRTGGRHPVTGRVIYRRIGGGVYREHYMLDSKRRYIPETETIEEKIIEIRDDPIRTGKIALVGHKDEQRWVMSTENMRVGQILKSSRAIGRIAIRAFEGDTYCVGALPMGTVVSSVQSNTLTGGLFATAAGSCAQILKKDADGVTIQLPSKQLIKVSEHCLATVGRISNVGWKNVDIGSAGASRRRGIRPKSGLWHRKDQYSGRKIHPPKPLRNYTIRRRSKPTQFAFQPSLSL